MKENLCSTKLRNGSFSYTHTVTKSPNNGQHQTYTLNCYEIYYLVSGNVSYQVENKKYELNAGDLLIINNKEAHRPYFTSDESYERIIIFFTPEFCSHYNSEEYPILQYFEKRKPGAFNRLVNALLKKENISGYFDRMEQLIRSDLPQNKTLIELTFIELLIKVNEIIALNNDLFDLEFDYNKKVEQIISFINNHLYCPLTLNEIENKFYINKYYFSHLFKKITGVSFKEYVMNKRVAKAGELLKLSIPPSKVSEMVGFEDYSNFYKAFKKIEGVAPSKYH